jgi:hypothetical protein
MDRYLCCGSDRTTDADPLFCNACDGLVFDKLIERLAREKQAHDRALATLGPWGRVLYGFRYRFGSRMRSSQISYSVDRRRWWHGGQTLAERAWLSLVPAVCASKRVWTLAERFGHPG